MISVMCGACTVDWLNCCHVSFIADGACMMVELPLMPDQASAAAQLWRMKLSTIASCLEVLMRPLCCNRGTELLERARVTSTGFSLRLRTSLGFLKKTGYLTLKPCSAGSHFGHDVLLEGAGPLLVGGRNLGAILHKPRQHMLLWGRACTQTFASHQNISIGILLDFVPISVSSRLINIPLPWRISTAKTFFFLATHVAGGIIYHR